MMISMSPQSDCVLSIITSQMMIQKEEIIITILIAFDSDLFRFRSHKTKGRVYRLGSITGALSRQFLYFIAAMMINIGGSHRELLIFHFLRHFEKREWLELLKWLRDEVARFVAVNRCLGFRWSLKSEYLLCSPSKLVFLHNSFRFLMIRLLQFTNIAVALIAKHFESIHIPHGQVVGSTALSALSRQWRATETPGAWGSVLRIWNPFWFRWETLYSFQCCLYFDYHS